MTLEAIQSLLPYSPPFLFVDQLIHIDENGAKGQYTFPVDSFFYKGHFKNFPITPGVILTETMAQIGVVSLGIFLMRAQIQDGLKPQIALSSHEVDFYQPVFPGEKVIARSEKLYFRFGKLKCKVELFNEAEQLVCRGVIAGMMKRKPDETK